MYKLGGDALNTALNILDQVKKSEGNIKKIKISHTTERKLQIKSSGKLKQHSGR